MLGDFVCRIFKCKALPRFRSGLLLICISAGVIANAQSPASIRYKQSSGLTCNEIYDVLQDKKGYIWTATDRGVFRFDGYRFESFTTTQGLTDNTVFCIEEDYGGRIWLMPFNGELCYIENNKVVQYIFNDTLKKYLPGMRIARTLHVDPSGIMVIGYLLHGIIQVSATGKFTNLTSADSTMQRHYFAKEYEDDLLMGTIDANKPESRYVFTFESVQSTVRTPIVNCPRRHSVSGTKRSNGSWCFAFGNELIEIDATGNAQTIALPEFVLCLYEDQENCLWIGMNGGGARRYAPGTSVAQGEFEDFYTGEIVTSIVQDSERSFWIATHHNGLIYIPSIHVRSWNPFPITNDKPLALLPAEEGGVYSLWRDHGVVRISGDNSLKYLTKTPEKDGPYKTMSFNCDRRTLLIGTTITVEELDPETGNYRELERTGANSINCGPEGIFIGAAWNLHCLAAGGKDQFVGQQGVWLRPEKLFRDTRQQLWMGALDGLYRVIDTTLESYASVHPLLAKRIADITELADGTLVIATQSNGIVFMKQGEINVLDQADGFTAKLVVAMTPASKNSLWISVEGGLYQVKPDGKEFIIKEFPWLNGLLANGGACYYDQEVNRFWLANEKEILRIDADARTENINSPPIYIREVLVQDSTLKPDQQAELNYDQNYISITYSGLAFRLQGKVQYRYRMAGQEEKWNYTRQNTVEFASLEPGDYVFEIQAENENGTWSEIPAKYTFVINAPFWQTQWFQVCVLLLALTLCSGAVALRYRILRKRDLLREQALMYRQEALASQMNPHFVFNAMNTIQSLVLNEDKSKALEMFSSFATLLRNSLQHSGERYIALNEEIRSLELYFHLEQMRFGEKLKFSIDVSANLQREKISVPAMLVQPMVENAILHGIGHRETGGTVWVRFFMEGKHMVCEVEDDGVGRDSSSIGRESDRKKSGIKITQDRLQVLRELEHSVYAFGIIDRKCTETGAAKGTLVRFNMPHISNP